MASLQTLAVLTMAFFLSGCIGAGANSPVAQGTANTFPDVTGINLHGEAVRLPGDLDSDRNLVVVAYIQEHQRDVDTWIAALPSLLAVDSALRFYEVPAIGRSTAPFRLWLNNVMRSGIPSPEARTRTVTIYVDLDAFDRALGIPGRDRIHAFLLDGDGAILWRTDGAATPETIGALSDRLAALATAEPAASSVGAAP